MNTDFKDDFDYLKRKWREDVSDPATGLDAEGIRRELEAAVAEWAKTDAWPMVKARVFDSCCRMTAIDVSPRDWFPAFAFWTRHKNNPVVSIVAKRRDEIAAREHAAGRLPRDNWPSWCGYPDFDHSAPDWDVIVKLGFTGMCDRLLANSDGSDYYQVRELAMEGVFRLLDRLIAKSRSAATDSPRGTKVAASLERLRHGPPQTALDVLGFIYLYWVMSENFEGIQVRTLGNLDRLLTPYYRADLAAGRTTEAEFREQLRHFWWQWGSIDNYWGQPVYFGGTEADGSSVYNEVSRVLLDVHDELALPTPKLHLKVGRSTPDWVWRKALEMMRRQRSISFIGEEPHARVIRSLGYSEDEAREFAIWGCYEWAVKDSANDTFGAAVNLLKPMEELLARAAAGTFLASDFAAFKEAYFADLLANVVRARDFVFENEKHLWEINPSLLFSVATEYSVKTGRDAYQGGTAHGNNTGIWLIGTGTAVDALLAVREMVYERAEISLAELGRVLAANWEGHEPLRLRVLRSKRKWGNGDAEANALCVELVKRFSALVTRHPNSRGGVFKAQGHTARYHIEMGRRTGATPDGRKAGEEMSKNISPTMGADTEGATALVNSAIQLDACDLPGDFPLDVALLPNVVAGEEGLRLMRVLIERYFEGGGLVIQFNIQDAGTLRDAQEHPEKYENLQVRVCGWNVRWNDIPKIEQDKFILRQENVAG